LAKRIPNTDAARLTCYSEQKSDDELILNKPTGLVVDATTIRNLLKELLSSKIMFASNLPWLGGRQIRMIGCYSCYLWRLGFSNLKVALHYSSFRMSGN